MHLYRGPLPARQQPGRLGLSDLKSPSRDPALISRNENSCDFCHFIATESILGSVPGMNSGPIEDSCIFEYQQADTEANLLWLKWRWLAESYPCYLQSPVTHETGFLQVTPFVTKFLFNPLFRSIRLPCPFSDLRLHRPEFCGQNSLEISLKRKVDRVWLKSEEWQSFGLREGLGLANPERLHASALRVCGGFRVSEWLRKFFIREDGVPFFYYLPRFWPVQVSVEVHLSLSYLWNLCLAVHVFLIAWSVNKCTDSQKLQLFLCVLNTSSSSVATAFD